MLAASVLVLAGCGALDQLDDLGAESDRQTQTYGGDVEQRAVSLVRVIDGDSLEVAPLDGSGELLEVRLEGYNAPEAFVDGRETCNGRASEDALAAFLDGRALALVGDDLAEEDRFGRRLADVVADGRSAVVELIDGGHGLATGDDAANRARMKTAADAGRGLWGDRCGTSSTGLRFGALQGNPPGPDGDRLADEWVELVNDGPGAVDLDGWVLRDDTTGNRFPLAGELAPGATLTVRTGSGRDDAANLHLGESRPVWSNGGDSALLLDPDGVVAAWAFLD